MALPSYSGAVGKRLVEFLGGLAVAAWFAVLIFGWPLWKIVVLAIVITCAFLLGRRLVSSPDRRGVVHRAADRTPAAVAFTPAYEQPRLSPARQQQEGTKPSIGVWIGGSVVVAIACLVAVLLSLGGGGSPQPSALINVSSGGDPASAHVSTAFNVSPVFHQTAKEVSGTVGDQNGNDFHIALRPTYSRFELRLNVRASYSPAQLSGWSTSARHDFDFNCLDIAVPPNPNDDPGGGPDYYVYPISENFNASGELLTGTLVYPAVIPGTYSFDLNCQGANGDGHGSPSAITIGSLMMANLGIAAGTWFDNALVVYSASSADGDTVLDFGAIGGIGDGSVDDIKANACVANGAPLWGTEPDSSVASSKISDTVRGSSVPDSNYSSTQQWFELGTLTFDAALSQVEDSNFFMDCSHAGGGETGLYLR